MILRSVGILSPNCGRIGIQAKQSKDATGPGSSASKQRVGIHHIHQRAPLLHCVTPFGYLGVGRFCPYLSMPSRWIFDSSVWRGIPSFAAAPEGPEIRPWLSARAAWIISTSRSADAVVLLVAMSRRIRGLADSAHHFISRNFGPNCKSV